MDFKTINRRLYLIENTMDECGEEMQQMPSEGVNMNVSINGHGAESIRSIMDILRNIDKPDMPNQPTGDDEFLFGAPDEFNNDEDEDELQFAIIDDDYGNSVEGGSDEHTFGIDALTPTGNDLASKGKEARKQAGGGNPWNITESLRVRLDSLYNEMKK